MATILEPTIDRGPAPESSDRSFGFVFAAVFLHHRLLARCTHAGATTLVGAGGGSWPSPCWRWFGRSCCILLNRAWLAFRRLLHGS